MRLIRDVAQYLVVVPVTLLAFALLAEEEYFFAIGLMGIAAAMVPAARRRTWDYTSLRGPRLAIAVAAFGCGMFLLEPVETSNSHRATVSDVLVTVEPKPSEPVVDQIPATRTLPETYVNDNPYAGTERETAYIATYISCKLADLSSEFATKDQRAIARKVSQDWQQAMRKAAEDGCLRGLSER